MAITNQQNINFVQVLYPTQPSGGAAGADPVQGNNVTDFAGLFRAASDGDRQALQKICGGDGGPDFVCTANTTAADTVNFDIPWVQLLKLYAAQIANSTTVNVRVRAWVAAAAVANSQFTEVVANFQDIAGTMTITAANVATVQIGTTAATVSNSGTNLRVAVAETGAVSHQILVHVYVTHVQ